MSQPPRSMLLMLTVMLWAASAGLIAQPRPDLPGVWKPWKPFAAIASARQDQRASPADVKAFEAELVALNAVLKRAAGVATPVGFSVETWGHLAGYRAAEHTAGQPPPGRLPLVGALTFGAFPIFEYERGGKTVRTDTGETALLLFFVNQTQGGILGSGHVTDWGSVDTDAFLQPALKGEVFGLPRYGDGLVIARDPAALWTPLSLAAALDLVMVNRRAALIDAEGRHAEFTKQLAQVRDPARRAAKTAEAKKNAASMQDPEKFIAMMAEAARIEEETYARELTPAGGITKNLEAARAGVDEVTALLGALSEQEKAAPACNAASGATLKARFREAPAAGCVPIVRPNYGYFNPALPRSAPQVVIITPFARCFDTADKYNRSANDPGPHGCAANRKLVETMDKDAIRAWLR